MPFSGHLFSLYSLSVDENGGFKAAQGQAIAKFP
jgi:hypothetical protein